jgi:hypothetical protein
MCEMGNSILHTAGTEAFVPTRRNAAPKNAKQSVWQCVSGSPFQILKQ